MSVAFWIQFISPRDTLVGDSSPSCRCYLRIYVMGEEPGTVLSVNHEVFLLSMISSSHIAKFRLKLKKVGKTTRPFRCDLNQIPYDYTVEVRNIFKGLDLIDRVPDEQWTEVRDIVQETGIKIIPMEKKCKKSKWLSGEALQTAVKGREAKSKGEKERYKHLNAESQR